MAKIFFIEDNDAIREAVASYLKVEEHAVYEFTRIDAAREALKLHSPALIILDVMLPDGNGFVFAREIKKTTDIPILFLTSKTSETDRITGFEIGGEDYVTKPFSPRELVLRVRAILKRTAAGSASKAHQPEEQKWKNNNSLLTILYTAHKVISDGREITLTSAEWEILSYLVIHAGQVVSRDQLLGGALDYTGGNSARTIDTHIKNIRAKLDNQDWIETVRGYGYRFTGKPV